jgi:hypothetical protein
VLWSVAPQCTVSVCISRCVKAADIVLFCKCGAGCSAKSVLYELC